MPDIALDAFTLPADIVIACIWAKTLRVRRVGLFSLFVAAGLLVMLHIRSAAGFEVRMAYLLYSYVLVPFVFSTMPWKRTLLVVALVNILIMAGEIVASALWVSVTDLPMASYDVARANMPLFCFVHLVYVAFLAAAGYGLHAVLNRHDRVDERDLRFFAGFPAIQSAFLAVPLIVVVYMGRSVDVLLYGSSVYVFVCVAVDALLYRSFVKLLEKRREDQRVAVLAGELDAYLAGYDSVVREVERTAQARHDLRNQVQVALALAERGECARARGHLATCRERLSELACAADPGEGGRHV